MERARRAISTARRRQVTIDPRKGGTVDHHARPGDPADSAADGHEVRQARADPERAALEVLGTAMHLGAHVLLPEGLDTHPDARYPLFIYHGHFPPTRRTGARRRRIRTWSPTTRERFSSRATTASSRSTRYAVLQGLDRRRTSRACCVIEIQHANPFYDDSYAVNSANIGPYGDAIVKELMPYIEKTYRGIGAGLGALHVRRLDRRLGSDGRAGVLSRRLQRRLDRLPGSDRLPRLHRRQHLQGQERVLRSTTPWKKTPRPGLRNYLGHVARRSRR